MTHTQVVAELRRVLSDAGLRGSFLVRDLHTGDELGIDPDVELPIASLVKIPLAIAVLQRLGDGRLDAGEHVEIRGSDVVATLPMGLGQFRHPASIAVEDLLYLSTSVSDNVAAEALFDLVPPDAVHRAIADIGIGGIAVRHSVLQLLDSPAERLRGDELHLAHALAINAATPGGGHAVAQLDVSRANTGSARAFVDLLDALWNPSQLDAPVAARVRELMGANVIRHRLAPELGSDGSVWSSKTGTLLNLRHEVGVVEHDDGTALAVAAMTESTVPAAVQPAAEAAMAYVARTLHDQVR